MFHLTLKRIQVAIAAGRLDDAFEMLANSTDREHRVGQKLIDKLTGALVKRAAQHLASERVTDARSDVNKAMRLAGHCEAVAELAKQVSEVERQQRQRDELERLAEQDVRQQVAAGALTLGERLLKKGDGESNLALAASIERGRDIAADAATRIKQAMKENDLHRATEIVLSLSPDLQRHRLIVEQVGKIIDPIARRIEKDFSAGRLDRAAGLLQQIQRIAPHDCRANEWGESLKQCQLAVLDLNAGDWNSAAAKLALQAQATPGVKWVTSARDSLGKVAEQIQSVRTGPLGLLGRLDSMVGDSGLKQIDKSKPTSAPNALARPNAMPFGPSILRIDGIGGILLLPHDEITIGCASKSMGYDLALQVDGDRAPIVITRQSDDYFASSDETFFVGGQSTKRRLLASGNIIEFGGGRRQGRVRFCKPVAASSSATLELKSGRLKQRDIRNVALMADSLVLGPTGSHFPLAGADGPIILYRENQTSHGHQEYAVKQPGAGRGQSLSLGDSLLLGDLRFALSQASFT